MNSPNKYLSKIKRANSQQYLNNINTQPGFFNRMWNRTAPHIAGKKHPSESAIDRFTQPGGDWQRGLQAAADRGIPVAAPFARMLNSATQATHDMYAGDRRDAGINAAKTLGHGALMYGDALATKFVGHGAKAMAGRTWAATGMGTPRYYNVPIPKWYNAPKRWVNTSMKASPKSTSAGLALGGLGTNAYLYDSERNWIESLGKNIDTPYPYEDPNEAERIRLRNVVEESLTRQEQPPQPHEEMHAMEYAENPYGEPYPVENPYVEPYPMENPYVDPYQAENPYVKPYPMENPYVDPYSGTDLWGQSQLLPTQEEMYETDFSEYPFEEPLMQPSETPLPTEDIPTPDEVSETFLDMIQNTFGLSTQTGRVLGGLVSAGALGLVGTLLGRLLGIPRLGILGMMAGGIGGYSLLAPSKQKPTPEAEPPEEDLPHDEAPGIN